jgi:hypothetical protein
MKPGVNPDEHAIIYSFGSTPVLLPGEANLTKEPIPVVMNRGERPLSQAARIYFGIHHPIQYNVKVKDLGHVHKDWMPKLLGYWLKEQGMEISSDMIMSHDLTRNEADKEDEGNHQRSDHNTTCSPPESSKSVDNV